MSKKQKRLALLCGGWTPERKISLLSGSGVFSTLKKAAYAIEAFDLRPATGTKPLGALRSATPSWAKPLPFEQLGSRLVQRKIDLVLPILHGPGGEDGKLQGLLEMLDIAFCGSSQLASTLAMNKDVAKDVFRRAGIPVPQGLVLAREADPEALAYPCVVKPSDQGSAVGVSIVRSEKELEPALRRAWKLGERALVEEFIEGRELTVGVLKEHPLPVVEIKPNLGEFYDYKSKYTKGGSSHLCPAPLEPSVAEAAASLGLRAHLALGCRNYSRTDMILGLDGALRVLETNTQPGMTPVSLLPDAARAAGYSYLQLLEAMMEGA